MQDLQRGASLESEAFADGKAQESDGLLGGSSEPTPPPPPPRAHPSRHLIICAVLLLFSLVIWFIRHSSPDASTESSAGDLVVQEEGKGKTVMGGVEKEKKTGSDKAGAEKNEEGKNEYEGEQEEEDDDEEEKIGAQADGKFIASPHTFNILAPDAPPGTVNMNYSKYWVEIPVPDDYLGEDYSEAFGKCVPEACHRPKHILGMKKKWDTILALSSYPGSGNTWVRWMLQEGSRLYTSSVFCDPTLSHSGYPYECDRHEYTFNRVIAVKTHFPAFSGSTFHGRAGMPPPTAAIVIVRAPLDAILSFYTLKVARGRGGDFHTSKLGRSQYLGNKFKQFAITRAKRWRIHMERLNGRKPLGNEAIGIPLTLVHYEELVRDPTRSLYKIFTFIRNNLGLGDRMPEVKEAILCATRHLAGVEHRDHTKIFNPFTPSLVSHICNETKLFWNSKLWGKCESGLLQSQRNDVTFVPPPVVPTERCEAEVPGNATEY